MKIDKLGNMPGREVNLKPLTKLWKEVVVSTEDSLCPAAPKTFLGGSGGGISSSTCLSYRLYSKHDLITRNNVNVSYMRFLVAWV